MNSESVVKRYRVCNNVFRIITSLVMSVVFIGLFALPLFKCNYTVLDALKIEVSYFDIKWESNEILVFYVGVLFILISMSICVSVFPDYIKTKRNRVSLSIKNVVFSVMAIIFFCVGVILLKVGLTVYLKDEVDNGLIIKGASGYIVIIVFGIIANLLSTCVSIAMYMVVKGEVPEEYSSEFSKELNRLLNSSEKSVNNFKYTNDEFEKMVLDTKNDKNTNSAEHQYVIKKIGTVKYLNRVYDKIDENGNIVKITGFYNDKRLALCFRTEESAERYINDCNLQRADFEIEEI